MINPEDNEGVGMGNEGVWDEKGGKRPYELYLAEWSAGFREVRGGKWGKVWDGEPMPSPGEWVERGGKWTSPPPAGRVPPSPGGSWLGSLDGKQGVGGTSQADLSDTIIRDPGPSTWPDAPVELDEDVIERGVELAQRLRAEVQPEGVGELQPRAQQDLLELRPRTRAVAGQRERAQRPVRE